LGIITSMKLILLILSVFSLFTSCYADAGNAFRFKVNIELDNKNNVQGYFYFYSYEDKFDSKTETFLDYIIENENDTALILYQEIKTLKINENFNLDFAIVGSHIKIPKSHIKSIKLVENISFFVGDRIFEIGQTEYNFINNSNMLHQNIYNEFRAENCELILFSWGANADLIKVKDSISNQLIEFENKNQRKELNSYVQQIKTDLLDQNIMVIDCCSVL